jgi:hypothetical protein
MAGVLSQLAERTAVGFGSLEAGQSAASSVGVASVFEAALDADIPIITLRDELNADADYDAHVRALIIDALEAGDIVIAPASPVPLGGRDRMGFWRIDPGTGSTVDVMDDGSGAETVEYTIPLTRSFRVASCLFALSGSILAAIVEILDIGGFNTAKHGVSIAAIIFQSFSAARGWTGACK